MDAHARPHVLIVSDAFEQPPHVFETRAARRRDNPAWCSACLPSLWPPADRLDQAGRTGESGTRLRPSSIFVLPATSRYRKYLIRIFQIRDFTFAWQLLGHGGTILAFDGSRAEYYRQQAQRVRQLANSTRDSDIRYEYEQLADIYERLAAQADRGQIGR
jgi:hypothetical protein